MGFLASWKLRLLLELLFQPVSDKVTLEIINLRGHCELVGELARPSSLFFPVRLRDKRMMHDVAELRGPGAGGEMAEQRLFSAEDLDGGGGQEHEPLETAGMLNELRCY